MESAQDNGGPVWSASSLDSTDLVVTESKESGKQYCSDMPGGHWQDLLLSTLSKVVKST